MSVSSPFDGICKGGPWDGQRYRGTSNSVPLMKPAATGAGIFTRDINASATIESVMFGEYHYDGYGTWRWVRA